MTLAPSEQKLWVKLPKERPVRVTDAEINERYARGEGRIVIETNREKLPGFVASLKQTNYMDLRPFYQRRPRWSPEKQSLLIESFIMNIPVPPVFLYEKEYNSYEVMDGQQRITALRDFYAGTFELAGLKQWPEINGRTYQTLPDKIQAGLDRRSITSIVLLKESTTDEDEASSLRETVFERLNTGGVELTRQEIRNALYRGRVNNLVDRLSRLPKFRAAWGVPLYVENEIEVTHGLLDIPMYAKMEDVEMVLRFFALRHAANYRHGMQGFLDLYMRKAANFTDADVAVLEREFIETLDLANDVYGNLLFKPFDPAKNDWAPAAQKAYYDAVMVGMSTFLPKADEVRAKAAKIRAATMQMFEEQEEGTFTGRGNAKEDIQTRIRLFTEMVDGAIA
ncbi:DUF262 domain-containing protein [Mesorhizobium sp. M7A.F.Ce.TU.012.03.2.1]|uniref:DUF262 domain-containing protein n=1 Tax=Mesorhizobium sp. M7A.F.Ce.TU.012.03.2.1 TaxID=2493681 RepID=UPI000FDB915C|nr:DUF262 domain-containing protein [Mesorhizobium sp. M7A.F.Ce.TU.012.03.2.1]AZV20998.1 DUF262 domain-containing protein [Mesorhizobium sp. M7A.F.Ce.TU.012.03.2.1]